MSDSDADSYHEEGFPSLQCDQDTGSLESLPDLVLSAATTLSQTTQVQPELVRKNATVIIVWLKRNADRKKSD